MTSMTACFPRIPRKMHSDSLSNAIVNRIRLQKGMWLDYDAAVDVLYVHFAEKPKSDHSEMRDDGIILDYSDKELVGMTILEASQR